jgi:UDP-glucose 4-epimerase
MNTSNGDITSASNASDSIDATARDGVLITGICGRLGKHLARVLHRERRVVGVDRRAFVDKPKDIEHQKVDIRRKKLKDVFRSGDIKAVVHLGVMHDPRASAAEHHSWNVAGFTKLLEYVAQFRVPKLVVLSSANVYGPQPGNPQFMAEESPLLGGQNFSDIRDLIEVDMLAQSFFWKLPETETVILRPVHILGSVHNAASNFLRLGTIPTVMGYDPMVQVIHETDVVSAIRLALKPGVRGIFNVSGPEPLPLSRIIKMLGRSSIPVPYSFGKAVLRRLWQFRLTTFPVPELDHIRFVCMVDDQRARRVLGFRPTKSIEQTVLSVDDGVW